MDNRKKYPIRSRIGRLFWLLSKRFAHWSRNIDPGLEDRHTSLLRHIKANKSPIELSGIYYRLGPGKKECFEDLTEISQELILDIYEREGKLRDFALRFVRGTREGFIETQKAAKRTGQ